MIATERPSPFRARVAIMASYEKYSLATFDEFSEGERRMKWKSGISAMWLAAAVTAALLLPLAASAGAQRRGAARPEIERPDGAVWQVIRQNCISCHGIDDYGFFALDGVEWTSLIDTKHESLEQVALSDDDRNLLVDWLVDDFGPDSTPFPRSYVPPEITVFFTDPEAFRLMERACTECHSMDRIDDARYSLNSWRVVLVNMRENGAVISDEELETLGEWLSRTRGINPNQ